MLNFVCRNKKPNFFIPLMFKHNNNNVFMLLFHYTIGTLIASKENEASLEYIEQVVNVRNKFNVYLKPVLQFV